LLNVKEKMTRIGTEMKKQAWVEINQPAGYSATPKSKFQVVQF